MQISNANNNKYTE